MAETIEKVLATFKACRSRITELDGDLAAERKAIKVRAFRDGRALTDNEVARRKEISATRVELADAFQELSLNTLDALDTVSEVDDLLREINAINQQLSEDLDHLKTIESYAESAAKVAGMLAETVKVLAAFRPTLI